MTDPSRSPLRKQASLSYIEQSLKMITPPQQAPVTIYPGPKAGLQNLSKADLEIADRLAKLRKKSSGEVPSEEEMAARLAQLKGLPSDHYIKSSVVYQPPNNRTQSEQTDDLFQQVTEEVSLESKLPKGDDEIEERLAKLRGVAQQSRDSQLGPYEEQAQLSSVGAEVADIDFQEITNALKSSEKDAKGAVASLNDDEEIAAAISEAYKSVEEKSRKKYKKKKGRRSSGGHSTSEDEFRSGSDLSDSEFPRKRIDSREAAKEKEEVDIIVQMYTEEAQLKKEKKKKKKLAAAEGKEGPEVSSSETELSSSASDVITSDSELISDSD